MKKIFVLSAIAFISICFYKPSDHVSIIKEIKDERGLTSVIYAQGNETFALDYLTRSELDSLKNK